MGVTSSPLSGFITVAEKITSTSNTLKMSLWKVMTMPMSQVARVGPAQETASQVVGKFVWGKEGFKWISDAKQSSSGHRAPGGHQHQQHQPFSSDGASTASHQAL